MPFCYSPWNNIDISPTGDIAPCCKFQRQLYDQQFNIQTHTIQEYKNSQLLNKIKQEFLQDQWPQGCERCRIEEESSIASKRQLDWDRWQDYYKSYDLTKSDFITASIAFGNTCNLKCITCGPDSSSRWEKEAQDLFGKTVPHFRFYKNSFIHDFVSNAPGVIHLDIPGGEPFLSGLTEQKLLLQHYIDTDQARHVSLHYTTNATIFPDDDWWKLWTHFKEIDLQLSIDGIESRYEYIRYPAEWNTLIKNTNQYLKLQAELPNLRLSVSHTVSGYNIYYLDEFFSWCEQKSLPTPWLGRVHTPAHMRPTVWPLETRQIISQHLAQSTRAEVKRWAQLMLNHDDSHGFELFKQRLREHDIYRKLDFNTVFPELTQWV
jgi:radical SAM protein with 4Fe4S-binding SPASM domain